MANGLKCPLCGSWYSNDNKLFMRLSVGDVCGNQSCRGKDPSKCSPEHPCPGVLVTVEGNKLEHSNSST